MPQLFFHGSPRRDVLDGAGHSGGHAIGIADQGAASMHPTNPAVGRADDAVFAIEMLPLLQHFMGEVVHHFLAMFRMHQTFPAIHGLG